MDTKSFYEDKTVHYKMSGGRLSGILGLLPSHTNQSVLDVGCGSGDLAEILKSKGFKISGIDIAKSALEKANKFLDKSFCFSVEDSIWPEELMSFRFDYIIASEIVEHLFYPDMLLNQFKKILKPGGKIIITTPNFLFWKNRLRMLAGRFQYEKEGLLDYGHIRFFTIDSARKLFKDCHLAIVKENHFYPNLYKRHLDWLGRTIPGLFAYSIILLIKQDHDY